MLLMQKASDTEAEIQRVKIGAIRTEEEKKLMERKAHEAGLLATRMLQESERRTKEAEKLKEELVKALMSEKDAKEKLREIFKNSFSKSYILNSPVDVLNIVQRQYPQLQQLEASMNAANNSATCNLISNHEMDKLTIEVEKERVEYLEKSKHLHEQLLELRTEIEVLKVEDNITSLDHMYEDNNDRGENKYSTLRRTKSGSTKTRVAFFEEL